MRRIAQVSPHYPPLLGGLERVVEVLSTGLAREHDVRVVTTDTGAKGRAGTAVEDGVTVIRHRAVSVAHTSISPGMALSLLRIPRDTVIHLHCSQALVPELVWLCARVRRMKYAVHFHMEVDASGPLGKLLPFYKKHFFGPVLRGAAAVIALTDSQAEFLSTQYGVSPDRVYVVPNGVAEQFFLPPREPDTADGPLRLLFVGRLGAQKNVARLIEAMALTNEPVRLRIVGDGELRAQLESQAADLGLLGGPDSPDAKVEFRGRRDGADLVDEYAHAQAFVLPSDREGMALVAIEAMAAGLPVIATAVPGNVELLDGVGLLVEPTPLDLAAGIDRLAADAAFRADLAARSSAQASTHAWPAVLSAIEDVYDKAGL
jgi:glycosyltransferase involved in cell wall biosynthesis